jgi:hypothetical protein
MKFPAGKLPCWLVNRVTTIVAPKLLKKLHKACLKYPEWKMRHSSTGGNNSRWSPTALAVNPVPWRNIVYEVVVFFFAFNF